LTWIDPSGLTGCRDASRGGKTFLHGSDVKTVDNLVDTGLNRSAARELGGGDVFWMTEDLSTARVFAQVNPTGGPAAVAGTRLPGEVVDSFVGRGVMRFDAPTGAWQVVDWDAFNQAAKFFRVE
ncbi:MAG: hypothetical protein OXR73_07895, partial [Myxococcales bacterium]|nr:hypothetical protein [Myxococcales bacterium]